MTSVYVCNFVGDGLAPASAFRPDVAFNGKPFAVLMIDVAKGRCLLLCSDDTVTGIGVTNVLSAATVAGLRLLASTTNPTAGQRTNLLAWLSANAYQLLTAAQVTWADCVHFIARQVNPAADLALTTC